VIRALLLASLLLLLPNPVSAQDAPLAGSAVRITSPGSVGSGVFVGGRIIVTAAHLIPDINLQPTIVTDDGTSMVAEVVLVDRINDIALLRLLADPAIEPAPVLCTTAPVGTVIRGVGNPLGLSFISTWGHVAGAPQNVASKWPNGFIVDLQLIDGMSGGPLFNEAGEVVGLMVGYVATRNGPATMSVGAPSPRICALLGRT
jgi:S1-C subfamily serine protease